MHCLLCNFYDKNDVINGYGTCEPQDADFHCTHICNLNENEIKELESLTGKKRFEKIKKLKEKGAFMIDFEEKARVTSEADNTLERILSKQYDNFDQYSEVSKISDVGVAKLIIKRLLDKLK